MAGTGADTATVPRYEVDLDAPAAERWAGVVRIYAGQLRAVEKQIAAMIDELPTAVSVLAGLGESVLKATNKIKAVYYHEELAAIAKLAEMPLGKLVAMQLIYEACANCTSIVTPSAADDGDGDSLPPMQHIRTMDWAMDFLRPLTVEIVFLKNGAPVTIATTWVGYCGVLTGVALRPEGRHNFSVSVNFRAVGSGTFWTNLKKAVGSSWPVGFLVRETLENAEHYTQAQQWFRNSKLIAPSYISLCGTEAQQGCLITRERSEDLHFWDVAAKGPVVQPNMDHWSNDPDDSIMLSIQRRQAARKDLRRLLAQRGGATPEDLWGLMSNAPVCNEITVYGTYMCPAQGVLETRLPRPLYGFQALSPAQATRVSHEATFATCRHCHQRFDEALNAPGQCVHSKTWHDRYEDCSYLKCGFGLGPKKIGRQHWGCCYSTDRDAPCKNSAPHVAV
eukprot:TRINITY_DN151_c5_g1_i1.p1 TRINITY_DN151_c5_g1~~TRINITY_DN151_c5_g1_i1.p1  ORF type:complete len:449 (+),score=130.39 TRINITY_DN151_c5_g1_i1:55-1401(+)